MRQDDEHESGGPPEPDTSFEPGMPTPGPAWHRASTQPEAEGAATAPAEPPGDEPVPVATAGEEPPHRPSGAHLAAGIFLTVSAASLLAGVVGLLDAQRVGYPANAVACGIVFIALFLLAVLLRPGVGGEALRGALGVTSILFLVTCFGFAVDIGSSGGIGGESLRVKLAAVAGLFGLGMGGVGVAVPSSVGTGLGAVGVLGTVILSLIAAGVASPLQLAAATLATAAALIVVGLRVPAIRPHRSGLAWLVGVSAVVGTAAAVTLAADFNGVAVAAVLALVLAFALLAWRHRLVVPAITAVPALVAVEVWVIEQAAGRNNATAEALVALVISVILVLLVAGAATAVRIRPGARAARLLGLTELLLIAAAALAIASLTQTSEGHLPQVPGPPSAAGNHL